MALKRVIPCLDVDRGRVVKGTNFVGLRDAGDPVELAERYDAEGADELVFLDITASHEGRGTVVELADQLGARQRRGVDRDLVGPGVEDRLGVGHRPDAAADRERDEDVVGRSPGERHDRLAPLVRSGYVEKDQLVGALGVVALGQLNRIPRVAQADEVGALDDATGVDVEAGDDSLQDHGHSLDRR